MPLMMPFTGNMATIQHNMTATPSATAGGTSVTGSGSAHTMGSWTTIISSTNTELWGFSVFPMNNGDVNVLSNLLMNIGVGAAASERTLVGPIPLKQSNGVAQGAAQTMFFPLRVPKGERIAIQHQSNVTSQTGHYIISCFGGGTLPPWQVFEGTETIGADTANSRGTLHTAGSTGTYSTYVNLGSTTTKFWKAFTIIVDQGTDTTMTNMPMYIRVGIGGTTLWQFVTGAISTEYFTQLYNAQVPIQCSIPAGTQFQVQATCSTTADTDFSITILGYY